MARRLLRADEYQRADDLVRRLAVKYEPQIAQSVAAALSEFQDDQDDEGIRDAILSGGAAGAVAALGFDRLRLDLGQSLTGLDGLFREAATETARQSQIAVSAPDVIALPQAADVGVFYSDLDQYRTQLIDDIVTSSEDSVAAAVQAGAAQHIDVATLARSVKNAIGLNERQAFAVFNYRRALEEGNSSLDRDTAWALRDRRFDASAARAARGEPLDQDLIDRMVGAYADRQLTYRARMIAQGEALKVANAAQRANYVQAINNGVLTEGAIRRAWRVALDERTCALCLSIPILNPTGVGMNEPFMSIEGPVFDVGLHPWCSCSIAYSVVGTSLAAVRTLVSA